MRQFRAICLAALLALGARASADVVEHQHDRYIIHVDQMDLDGSESLMEILLMCPDVLSIDGKTPQGSNLYGNFVVRLENFDICVDPATFLANVKAREVRCVKILSNDGVSKGHDGLKQVIDVYMKSAAEGNSGRTHITADSYGTLCTFNTFARRTHNTALNVLAEGGVGCTNLPRSTKQHSAHDGVKANLTWQATDKDYFTFDLKQTFDRDRDRLGMAHYGRLVRFDGIYKRKLHNNGAYFLFKTAGKFVCSTLNGRSTHSTSPYVYTDFIFPLFNRHAWLTAGMEQGCESTHDFSGELTQKGRYEDFYLLCDITLGKWTISLNDRFRVQSYWQKQRAVGYSTLDIRTTRNFYTASVYYKFNPRHTLQATYARRFYPTAPNFSAFLPQQGLAPELIDRAIHTAELKYTFATPSLMISPVMRHIRQDVDTQGAQDNTLTVGTTVFAAMGKLRLTAGINYYWQHLANNAGNRHFAQFKLAPQYAFGKGWRASVIALYNTGQASFTGNPYLNSEFQPTLLTPANCYAEVKLEKNIRARWLLEVKGHDLIHQQFGNRAATIGVTYYW